MSKKRRKQALADGRGSEPRPAQSAVEATTGATTSVGRGPDPRRRGWLIAFGLGVGLAVVATVTVVRKTGQESPQHPSGAGAPATATPDSASSAASPASATHEAPDLATLEANTAVMVTVELELGVPMPSVSGALSQVERRHQPDDGTGRTFAILDAYGEPAPDGRKLHLSMHVSGEKPGMGSLVLRRTGEVLWEARILAATKPSSFSGQDLSILIDDGAGKAVRVDGSRGPRTVLDANLQNSATLVREFWPNGAEREVTFIYSACGCPVKAMVRRNGERTVRTRELPVMFPDDPAVMQVIGRLMGWQ